MEETKKKRRSVKEILGDMIKINQRKPPKEELTNLINIINENAIPDNEDDLAKIVINRDDNRVRLRCTNRGCEMSQGFFTSPIFVDMYLNEFVCILCKSKHAKELVVIEGES